MCRRRVPGKKPSYLCRFCTLTDFLKSIPLPNRNYGLAADDLRERLPYLQRMVHVMIIVRTTKDKSQLVGGGGNNCVLSSGKLTYCKDNKG